MMSMKKRFFLLAACCAAMVCVSAPLRAAGSSDPKTDGSGWILPGSNVGTGWHLRLKDARAEAAKDGKPILIVFSGPDWSSSSRSFESSVLKSREFASAVQPAVVGLYIQHFVNVSAPPEQVSANLSLRKALGVPSVYPCTVVLGSDGKTLLGIVPGAMEKKAYLRTLGELAGIAVPQ